MTSVNEWKKMGSFARWSECLHDEEGQTWKHTAREADSNDMVCNGIGKNRDLSGDGKSLFIKTNQEPVSCSSQTTTSDGESTDTWLKNILSTYVGFAFNVEKEILKSCSREFSELISFILVLRRNWKRRSEELEKTGLRREDGMMLVPSTLFFEFKLYMQ